MCLVGLQRPRALCSSGCCQGLHGTTSGGREVARFLCVRNSDGEGTGSKQGRKDIVVIMKFARKQRKHIYPLPVAYSPLPPSHFLTYLPNPFPAAFRIEDNQEK